MTPVLNAALRSWSIPPAPTFLLLVCGLTYLRGWWLLWRAGFRLIAPWRVGAFLAGLLSLFTALASPMDVFNGFLLTAHMLQHMTLMMVAPPLLLLGNPLLPILRGMPRFAAREYAGPLLRWPPAKQLGSILIHPVTALLLMGIVNFAWHTPRLYDLALRSDAWHQTEHSCFFLAALIFWWPVVQPWPSKSYWPRWAMVPYLVIADLQNTTLSAILVFSDRLLYPYYAQAPGVFGLTPQQDQAAAGAMMWVVGSLAYIVPAIIIAVQCLSRRSPSAALDRNPFELTRNASPKGGTIVARGVSPGKSQNKARVPSGTAPFRNASRLLTSRRSQAVTFSLLFAAIGLTWAWLAANATDDDLQLLAHQRSSRFELYLFGPEEEISVGDIPIAVLVQDAQTGSLLPDAAIDLSLEGDSAVIHAQPGDSENKLLRASVLQVRHSGDFKLRASVASPPDEEVFVLPFAVAAAQPDPPIRWPYYTFGAAAAALGLIYVLRHREKPHEERKHHASDTVTKLATPPGPEGRNI